MRGLAAFLFFCLAVASASVIRPTQAPKNADPVFLERQLDIIRLFYRLQQPNTYTKQVTIAKEYDIKANIANYDSPDVVNTFLHYYNDVWFLAKGRVYSVMYKELMNETVPLFDLFYHAKDFDTFYKTACWAREHINEEMFAYTLTAAMLFRKDTQDFYIPPFYEIFPNYFFTTEVMDRAYKVQMQKTGKYLPNVFQDEKNPNKFYVYANYSSWYYNYNWEQRLAYFTEDIGLNTFYFNHHLRWPYWMDRDDYKLPKENGGQIYYYVQQQLLARYYLERLSNGMGEIPEFSYEDPIEFGYDPQLSYTNGMKLPVRPNNFEIEKEYFLIELEDYERRIRDAVAKGYAVYENGTHESLRTPEAIETLGNMVSGSMESPDWEYYGSPQLIARALLGNSPQPSTWHAVVPSALEFYQTSLRDPMYYQIAKRFYNTIFWKYQKFLQPYTREELACPGVTIETVNVGDLVTYMEDVDTEITNGVYGLPNEELGITKDLEIVARQKRLNHKPFTITVNVMSEKAEKVVFRLFIGPKYNGQRGVFTLDKNRHNFFRLDRFVYELKSGKNPIEWNSQDFHMFEEDWEGTREVAEQIRYAMTNKVDYDVHNTTEFLSFPGRLLLPKGTRGGMPFYLYVLITPWTHSEHTEYQFPMVDQHTNYGYPFDRPVFEENFQQKNMMFKEVNVYHRTQSEVNKV